MAHLTEEQKAIQMLRAPEAMGALVVQPRDGDKLTLRCRDLEFYGTKAARGKALREWRKRKQAQRQIAGSNSIRR